MNSFGNCPLYDPRGVRENRARFRRDKVPHLDRANSVYVPTGRWAARGWVLVARSDYTKLNPYSTGLQMQISDNVVLQNLSVVQARCVTRGLVSDPNSLYLVEVTDSRGVLHNQWFQTPLTAAYNVRAPGYPDTFQPWSVNPSGSVPWTWTTILHDVWNKINATGTLLGAWPGLPITPAGVPEGFWFIGVPAWYALNDVLDHLGLTVACDLTSSSPFTIVQPGAVDSSFSALSSKYNPTAREDDSEWIDAGAARVPGHVTVLFRRRNQVYGTEETVRSDAPYQWDANSYYTPGPIAAPGTFTGAVGTHCIWDDFTVRYDIDSNPLAADVTTAAAIAAERVAQYYGRIYRQTSGFMSRTYAGALPFATGSQVDGVCWEMNMSNRAGWLTQVVRGAVPPWPGLWE